MQREAGRRAARAARAATVERAERAERAEGAERAERRKVRAWVDRPAGVLGLLPAPEGSDSPRLVHVGAGGDEALHSRQMAAVGAQAQARLSARRIRRVGVGALGQGAPQAGDVALAGGHQHVGRGGAGPGGAAKRPMTGGLLVQPVAARLEPVDDVRAGHWGRHGVAEGRRAGRGRPVPRGANRRERPMRHLPAALRVAAAEHGVGACRGHKRHGLGLRMSSRRAQWASEVGEKSKKRKRLRRSRFLTTRFVFASICSSVCLNRVVLQARAGTWPYLDSRRCAHCRRSGVRVWGERRPVQHFSAREQEEEEPR